MTMDTSDTRYINDTSSFFQSRPGVQSPTAHKQSDALPFPWAFLLQWIWLPNIEARDQRPQNHINHIKLIGHEYLRLHLQIISKSWTTKRKQLIAMKVSKVPWRLPSQASEISPSPWLSLWGCPATMKNPCNPWTRDIGTSTFPIQKALLHRQRNVGLWG